MTQQIMFVSPDQSLQTFGNFYPANNRHLISALKDLLSQPRGFACVYLYGHSGSGKTHLLKSAVHALGPQTRYLDLQRDSDRLATPGDDPVLLALDNLESAKHREAELMMAFEAIKQNAGKLLLASATSPRALELNLEDLRSRLASGQVFEIKPLNDEDKISALKFRAGLRGFELSDEVVSYVINRYPRDLNTLFELLDIIDNASLTSQRKITVPFVKKLENEASRP